MQATQLSADCAVTGAGIVVHATVTVHDGVIAAVEARGGTHERQAGTLLPGMIDLQVNGAGGASVDEATPGALDQVARAVFDGGAVAFLPTLITAPFDRLLQQVRAVAAWIEQWRGTGAEPLGLHLEGPFLSAPGAHDPALFVDPTPERVRALLEAARGRLRLVTLANNRQGAPAAVAMLRAAGVAVALGHVADDDQFDACVAAGARLVTHLFNVMGPLHHREPGIAGRALDDTRLCCPLIVDGAHVHPVMVRNAFRILGPSRTILVSDAVAAAGMADGEYSLSGMRVTATSGVVRDGKGNLAGSALTMARAARNFLDTVPDAGPWTLASLCAANPARCIGADAFGAIAPGRRAAFTLLGDDGSVRAIRC